MSLASISSQATCWDYFTVDDLAFSGEKAGQKRQLIDVATAQRMFCSLDRVEVNEVTKPLEDIEFQNKLLDQRLSQGKISRSAHRYYKSWLSEIKSNLFRCYRYAYDLRELTTPLPTYQTRMKIEHANAEVIQVQVFNEAGELTKKFLTHKYWIGRVIGDAGLSLCQADYNPSL